MSHRVVLCHVRMAYSGVKTFGLVFLLLIGSLVLCQDYRINLKYARGCPVCRLVKRSLTRICLRYCAPCFGYFICYETAGQLQRIAVHKVVDVLSTTVLCQEINICAHELRKEERKSWVQNWTTEKKFGAPQTIIRLIYYDDAQEYIFVMRWTTTGDHFDELLSVISEVMK